MTDLCTLLSEKQYPGRGIAIGRTPDGSAAVVLYFIMGRSENSRNRIFSYTDDGIRTEAFDPALLTDPSLIIYHPVRQLENALIVTNGDQTDTIRDALAAGGTFEQALRTRSFEPDGPNWTPRISGLVRADGSFELSILKSDEGDARCCVRAFFDYDAPIPGTGRFLSTYRDNGSPLPSFAGEPIAFAVPDDVMTFADAVWAALNEENRVALYACRIDLADWTISEHVINKHMGG